LYPDERSEQARRILVLALTRSDARMIERVLVENGGMQVFSCPGIEDVILELAQGAGALLIAEEALSASALARLSSGVRAEPPWSELPIVVLAGDNPSTDARMRVIEAIDGKATMSIVERPVRALTLIMTMQAALAARRRQYEIRDLLARQDEQMRQLMTEKEMRARFVSLLAHDLRGPLTSVTLGVQMLELGIVEKRGEVLGRMRRNVQRIEKMIRDLLDVSRLQANHRLLLEMGPCDLGKIAADVVDELSAMHADRIVLDAAQPVLGYWSSEELRRAIWNLATNAIKYGSEHTPVTVSVRATSAGASVSVHNRGLPLSEEEQEHIFEPFARTPSSENSDSIGWGLGLALVRACAEAHGGSAHVSSSELSGTTFTLSLPLDSRAFNEVDSTPRSVLQPDEPQP
jgi:signal transduction histidine kinase